MAKLFDSGPITGSTAEGPSASLLLGHSPILSSTSPLATLCLPRVPGVPTCTNMPCPLMYSLKLHKRPPSRQCPGPYSLLES